MTGCSKHTVFCLLGAISVPQLVPHEQKILSTSTLILSLKTIQSRAISQGNFINDLEETMFLKLKPICRCSQKLMCWCLVVQVKSLKLGWSRYGIIKYIHRKGPYLTQPPQAAPQVPYQQFDWGRALCGQSPSKSAVSSGPVLAVIRESGCHPLAWLACAQV